MCSLARNPPASFNCNTLNHGTSYQATDSSARGLLPQHFSCTFASASPEVCCASMSNRSGSTGQDCIAAPPNIGSFSRYGRMCEALPWVLANEPSSYDSGYCDSLVSKRITLPASRSCSSITSKYMCCNVRQSDGQACVASSSDAGFETGNVCETAKYATEEDD